MMRKSMLFAGVLAAVLSMDMVVAAEKGLVVTDIRAEYRAGQVFLTWKEADTPPGTTFNVYAPTGKFTSLDGAKLLARHVEVHSARDWWKDPASFDKAAAHGKPEGFVVESGGKPLDPAGGLFVHTLVKGEEKGISFAVTCVSPDGVENRKLGKGNVLATPIKGKIAQPEAIWIGEGPEPAKGSAKGKPLFLSLHHRGGGVTAPCDTPPNWLYFGDSSMGWREGLPFEFRLTVDEKGVSLSPNDRAWTGGRPQSEAKDPRNDCPAVNTWWFGYNEKFDVSANEPKTVVPNYTERWVLGLVHWAQGRFETDRPATYVSGGSMGGSGAVALCLRHPEEFAAAFCEVPMVRFVASPVNTLNRLEATCGPIDEKTMTAEGKRLVDWVDGVWQAKNAAGDLPYLFIWHGRTDGSIPWQNNPPFYRAMEEARQGFSVYWNNEGHTDVYKHVPEDVAAWRDAIIRFRLDRSFPLLTNASDSRNPGEGDPKDGDVLGWMHRGLSWKDIEDGKKGYAITLILDNPEAAYPVTADVTIRRLQSFRVKPGQRLSVRVGAEKPRSETIGKDGLLSIPAVRFPDNKELRIEVR